jgi:hypothetical protein
MAHIISLIERHHRRRCRSRSALRRPGTSAARRPTPAGRAASWAGLPCSGSRKDFARSWTGSRADAPTAGNGREEGRMSVSGNSDPPAQ